VCAPATGRRALIRLESVAKAKELMLVRRAALPLGLLLAIAPGTAGAQSALEMRSYCQPLLEAELLADDQVAIPRTFNVGRCWGSFQTFQGLSTFRDLVDGRPEALLGICAPESATLLQYVKVFTDYADAHPERLHEDWHHVAWTALAREFPCQ
jgi:hypothetical protein